MQIAPYRDQILGQLLSLGKKRRSHTFSLLWGNRSGGGIIRAMLEGMDASGLRPSCSPLRTGYAVCLDASGLCPSRSPLGAEPAPKPPANKACCTINPSVHACVMPRPGSLYAAHHCRPPCRRTASIQYRNRSREHQYEVELCDLQPVCTFIDSGGT